VEGSCEHGIEPSGSIKCWEVLEWLHNWRLLKKGSAAEVSTIRVQRSAKLHIHITAIIFILKLGYINESFVTQFRILHNLNTQKIVEIQNI
jgi:hypothetical protein